MSIHIEKHSVSFQLLIWLCRPFHRLFYRRWEVTGRENIPAGVPVIFAANHQNSLMDALAIIFATRGSQIVFLARADIFKKKTIARVLNFIRILPVYRMRDGIEHMGQNDDTFDRVMPVLSARRAVGIFPEGTQADKHHLFVFKKGLCRMAFRAEEMHDFTLGVKIIPVGLTYSDYYNRNADLLVQFGRPIDVSDFRPAYQENVPRAFNELLQACRDAMSPLTLDIRSLEFYDPILAAADMYAPEHKLQNNLAVQQKVIAALNHQAEQGNAEQLKNLSALINKYAAALHKQGVTDQAVRKKNTTIAGFAALSLVLLCSLPLVLSGALSNGLPAWLASKLSRKFTKDKGFLTSFEFGLYFLLSLVYYPLLFVAIGLSATWVWAIIVFPLALLCGLVAYKFPSWFRSWKTKRQQLSLYFFHKPAGEALRCQRAGIINEIDAMVCEK